MWRQQKILLATRVFLWLLCFATAWLTAARADEKAALPLVWVNTKSKVYHYPGCGWYGTTQQGKYVTEAEALAEGNHADQTERHRPSPAPYPNNQPVGNPRDGSGVVLLPLTPKSGEAAITAIKPTSAPVAPSLPTATPEPLTAVVEQTNPATLESLELCVQAITSQSDPTKLATLGERGANPRLKRIMYYLAQARAGGAVPASVIDQAQQRNGSAGTPRAELVKTSLLRNLKICDGLGLLTPGNTAGLRRGEMPTVTRGPYVGQGAEVDHIVPRAVSPETDNELANLELLPAGLNRSKSAKVGERQLALAKKFREAGLISETTMANVQAAYRPSGTLKYEMQE